MRLLLAAAVFVLTATTSALAQHLDPLAVPDAVVGVATVSEASVRNPAVDGAKRQIRDKKFWTVAAALGAAMVLDTRSTFHVVDRCTDCREANPLVAPFVRLGPTPTYTAGVLFDAGVMAIAAKMKGSNNAWLRRTWWVAPVALVIGHSRATRNNYDLVR